MRAGALLLALVAVAWLGDDAWAQAPTRVLAPEKAAEPAMSLDQILTAASSYDGGIDSGALWQLRDYVYARKDDPAGRAECEAKLLAFLKSPATAPAKAAASRLLRVIAGDTAVPALQVLLTDAALSDPALFVLRQIPGTTAERALVQAAGTTSGTMRIAVVAALGERRDASAVPALVPLLKQPEYRAAAATALARIGGAEAVAALEAALAGAPADFKPHVAAAILTGADSLLAAGNRGGALRLYEMLGADATMPAQVRRAAAIGKINAWGNVAQPLVLEMLGGPDPIQREAAVAKIRDVFEADSIGRVCTLLPRLPEATQIPVLAAIAGYPGDIVLPAVLQAARSNTPDVRIAAMKALESTGGASVVPFLVETAVSTRGNEQTAARSALGMLKGRPVDEAMVDMLAKSPSEDVARELLLSMADRQNYAAKPAVAAALASLSQPIRVQALKTLRVIATPSDIPTVLDALLKTGDEVERAEARQTAASLALKIAGADDRSSAVRARLASEKDPAARAVLIGVLPLVGDRGAIPVLRAALADGSPDVVDAAVNALTSWPTSAARDDVARIVRTSKNETHRLLALRGFVRMVGLDQYRDPSAAAADLKQAAEWAWRPEEKKLALGALVRFAGPDALAVANRYLRDKSVRVEAQAAVDAIKARLAKRPPGA